MSRRVASGSVTSSPSAATPALQEAELFVAAEHMLVEVLGRVRRRDHDIVLPAMHPRAPGAQTIESAVLQQVQADVALAAALEGRPGPPVPPTDVGGAARRACAAAVTVDGGRRVRAVGRELPMRDLLLEATVERSLLAHYVAAYLGSTACPLPEELARPLWELTAPHADAWRRAGWFREPLELPPHVSWRDRFLLTAGHLPHPLGH